LNSHPEGGLKTSKKSFQVDQEYAESGFSWNFHGKIERRVIEKGVIVHLSNLVIFPEKTIDSVKESTFKKSSLRGNGIKVYKATIQQREVTVRLFENLIQIGTTVARVSPISVWLHLSKPMKVSKDFIAYADHTKKNPWINVDLKTATAESLWMAMSPWASGDEILDYPTNFTGEDFDDAASQVTNAGKTPMKFKTVKWVNRRKAESLPQIQEEESAMQTENLELNN
jgi:hypothetical protein